MGVTKYLYGASVQGIQSFIFQTNKLKEIVGASGLVEEICTNLFEENFARKGIACELVVSAAGNVKCIFDKEEDWVSRKLVGIFLNLRRIIITFGYGKRISQSYNKHSIAYSNIRLLHSSWC